MIGNLISNIGVSAQGFVKDPIGTLLDSAVQPVEDVIDVLDGLSEGELREQAALRLGAEVVAGLALTEVIEFLEGE